jgi:hypothetical protein
MQGGAFQPNFGRTAEMQSYLGKMSDSLGNEFTQVVASRLGEHGWTVTTDVPMSRFGADPGLGDLDVLAWRVGDRRLLCIECKRLMPARTPSEILEVLTRFRGHAGDMLGKHRARVEWIEAHLKEVGKTVKAKFDDHEASPFLVTSAVVPMQFALRLPLEPGRIVPFAKLEDILEKV